MKNLFVALLCLLSVSLLADNKVFVREYYYQASESDSKITARTKALSEVKRLLLEELGVYMESYTNYITEDKNGDVSKRFFSERNKIVECRYYRNKDFRRKLEWYSILYKSRNRG